MESTPAIAIQEERATVEMLKETASPVGIPTGEILEGKAEKAISIARSTDKDKSASYQNISIG